MCQFIWVILPLFFLLCSYSSLSTVCPATNQSQNSATLLSHMSKHCTHPIAQTKGNRGSNVCSDRNYVVTLMGLDSDEPVELQPASLSLISRTPYQSHGSRGQNLCHKGQLAGVCDKTWRSCLSLAARYNRLRIVLWTTVWFPKYAEKKCKCMACKKKCAVLINKWSVQKSVWCCL